MDSDINKGASYYIIDIIFHEFTQMDYNNVMNTFLLHPLLDRFIIKALRSYKLKDGKRRYRVFVRFNGPTILSFPYKSNYSIYILYGALPTVELTDEELNDDAIIFNHEPDIDTNIIFYCSEGVTGQVRDYKLIVCLY